MLSVPAGRDLNIVAGVVSNAGTGTTALSAVNNQNLSTVQIKDKTDITWDAQNYQRYGTQSEVGSQVTGGGGVSLSAGNNLNARAANVQAVGALTAVAGNNVSIVAGQSSQALAQGFQNQD